MSISEEYIHIMYSWYISQAIYTLYRPFRQTKCPQFALHSNSPKLNVHQTYRVYGM